MVNSSCSEIQKIINAVENRAIFFVMLTIIQVLI